MGRGYARALFVSLSPGWLKKPHHIWSFGGVSSLCQGEREIGTGQRKEIAEQTIC